MTTVKNTIVLTVFAFLLGCTTQPLQKEGLPMSRIPSDRSIDMRDKTISPFIVYHAVKQLQSMQAGETLEIVTDRFEAIENDLNAWCRMTGHQLAELETGETFQRYYIRKGAIKTNARKLAMIISEPYLETLISPLGLALSAAMSGTDVCLYFQGPAVRVLKKKYRTRLKGLARPFTPLARKGLNAVGHIPPREKLKQLRELGARFYICGGSMDPFGVSKADLIFEDIVIAEYFTFFEIMQGADLNIFLQ